MSEIDGLIQRLDTWLQKNRPEYYANLNPGATDEEITKMEETLSYKLPEDLISFYCWKNGYTSPGKYEDYLYGVWEFQSIGVTIYSWNGLNEAILLIPF